MAIANEKLGVITSYKLNVVRETKKKMKNSIVLILSVLEGAVVYVLNSGHKCLARYIDI